MLSVAISRALPRSDCRPRIRFVVIVAHSLGSLISADLLRFLHAEGDDAFAPLGLAGEFEQHQGSISLKLLTMGNPTRQLLNRFFPYLYDWVRENPDNGTRPLPTPVAVPPARSNLRPGALPDPAELGLTMGKAYRSGDYVGRSLWLTSGTVEQSAETMRADIPNPSMLLVLGTLRNVHRRGCSYTLLG